MADITVQYTSTAHAYFAGAYLVPNPSGLTPQFFIVQLVDRDLEAFASDALRSHWCCLSSSGSTASSSRSMAHAAPLWGDHNSCG